MMQAGSGAFKCPFPEGTTFAATPFQMAEACVYAINTLRTRMFKSQGIEFQAIPYQDHAHGHSENGFDYKLGFRCSGHAHDPLFSWIQDLQSWGQFPGLYIHSDDTVKHPYPHEIFLNRDAVDALFRLIENKSQRLQKQTQEPMPQPVVL